MGAVRRDAKVQQVVVAERRGAEVQQALVAAERRVVGVQQALVAAERRDAEVQQVAARRVAGAARWVPFSFRIPRRTSCRQGFDFCSFHKT